MPWLHRLWVGVMCKTKTLNELRQHGDIDGHDILQSVKSQGGDYKPGHGDHFGCYDKQGHYIEPCPNRPLGRGLALKIIKTLMAAGFTAFLYGIAYHMNLIH